MINIYNYEYSGGSLDVSWLKLVIYKSKEKLELIDFEQNRFFLDKIKFPQLNMIYTWQSKLFTCKISDSMHDLYV